MEVQAIIILYTTLLHISMLAAAIGSGIGGSERDHVALLAFKSNIKHDPQGVMSYWNESLPYCEWQGVTCSRRHPRVTILDLHSRGLVGNMSPYIGNLSFLKELRLENNTLQGKIPTEIGRLFRLENLRLNNNSLEGEIPANIFRCSNLVNLTLGNNKFGGKIPDELGSLSKLKLLSIHKNNLTGGIPPSIGNLTSLKILSAAYNKLGETIPDIFHRLNNLREIGLAGNQLSGIVPPSLYNLSHPTVLSLSENQLHGSLPPNFGILFPHLQFLQLRKNHFTGAIPSSLSNASELEFIEISQDKFSGKVFVDFGGMKLLSYINVGDNNLGTAGADDLKFVTSLLNCSNLAVISIRDNNFGGVLPNSKDIGNFSTPPITFLEIDKNQISGRIPSWIGTLINLTSLIMFDNQLIGPIPVALGQLTKLSRMYLSENRLSGQIPASLGNLTSLTELQLQNNRLKGTLPSSLRNCQKLLSLYVSQNGLKGTIPKEIFEISSLVIVGLSQNHLVGFLPSEVGTLKHLVELYLSGNELYGQIPDSLGGCNSLQYLSLRENFFHGPIPPSFTSLRGLEKVDLSRNNLSGQIPHYLERFSLTYLNLSFNDFVGEVPSKGVFTNATAVSVIGNNRLCGGIPELKLPRCSIKESKKHSMSSLAIILISIACILLGVALLSFFIYLWSKKKRNDKPSESIETLWKVSYAMLLKATDGFSTANLIGVGSFGSVYKGIIDLEEQIVAIKVLNLQRQGASKSFLAECEALRNIRHRNLVKILTSCSSVDFQGNDFKALIYEFMPNGSLEMWLHQIPESRTNEDELRNLSLLQRINIAIDVAGALEYLHRHCQPPIVHCDLKPSNILLDDDMNAHVGDFGLAKLLQEFTTPNQCSSIGVRGTIGYAAPEYGLGSAVSTSGDVYSFGILLLEMITGKKPTNGLFEEGHNLHKFAKLSLPDRVMEIVDPILSSDERPAAANNGRSFRQGRNEKTRKECLISMVKVGVACSMESPQDRMEITTVFHELHLARDIILSIETGQQRQRDVARSSEEV